VGGVLVERNVREVLPSIK